jgi:streptomycin 3"-adenylyltransferase
MLAGIPSLLADLAGDTRNVLLTLARIRTTLTTGTVTRKDSAAATAAVHLPPALRPVLERAGELYLAGSYGSWNDLPAAAAAQELVDQIRALSD